MDFNKIKYAGSFLKDFKHNMSLPDLTIGELYATLRWNNIKPVEKTKRVSGGKSGLYPWNEVEGLLKNHSALMMSRQRVLDNRKSQETQTKQPDTKQTSFNWGRENPNYYGSKDMEQLSNEYLANDEVWFDDENDDKLYESLFGKQHKKIHLTESQLNHIQYLKESEYHYHVDPQKVLVVKRFLDNTFLRATMPIVGSDGYPKNVKIVGMKGADGNVAKNMTAKQLFYLLQDKFQHIYGDKGKRDSFLKLVMKDWYERKITNDGMLSTNHY